MQLLNRTNSLQTKRKKAYISPTLINFGKIAELTAGGSYGNAEGGWWDHQEGTPDWIPPGQRGRMRS